MGAAVMSNVIHVRFARYREQGRRLLNARAVVLDAPQFALEGGTYGHATTERCRPRSNAVIAYPFANHALAYS